MASIINAVSSTGITQTADGSGIIKLQSNGSTTNALAWVSFVGSSGTIRSSYNVSSVTRSGTGTYTVNITNATSDANYAGLVSATDGAFGSINCSAMYWAAGSYTTTAFSIATRNASGSTYDPAIVSAAIFGN